MKKTTVWILGGLTAAVLLVAGVRLSGVRKAATPAASPASTAPVESLIELGAGDVYTVSPRRLALGLPVSGTLRASETAFLKARVAGELMNLVVREGDSVRAGQVLAHIDPVEYQARVRQAQQQADAAQAQVEIAQRQLDNNQALVGQGFISATALQTSVASLSGARATHQAALAGLDLARKALDDATLRAPISGQVSQRLSQPGERVAIDARVLEIVNLAQLELEAALPADDAAQVHTGMQAQLQVEGLEGAVSARVLRINPSAQAGSRSVLVYLGIAGREGLRQGVFAQGSIGTRSLQALAVPLSSVRTDKPQPYVQVLEQDTVRHVPVRTGARSQADGETWVVVEGLSEGTRVLTGGAGAVREGVKVKFTGASAS
jgi:RND family efflux transporter MFP subunit